MTAENETPSSWIDHKAEALKWAPEGDQPIAPLSTTDPDIVNARTIELAHAQVHATLHLADVIENASREIQYAMGANAAARGGF